MLRGNFLFFPEGTFRWVPFINQKLQTACVGHTVYQGSLGASPLMFPEGLQVSLRPLFWRGPHFASQKNRASAVTRAGLPDDSAASGTQAVCAGSSARLTRAPSCVCGPLAVVASEGSAWNNANCRQTLTVD